MVQRSGVLIETYWNVKAVTENRFESQFRINRNILECKESTKARGATTKRVLIETYWNVKKYTQTADLGYIPY